MSKNIEQDLLHELFDYKNGQLVNKISRGNIKAGSIAGTKHHSGYCYTKINKTSYSVHRIVWIYHNGAISDDLEIDHINRQRDDNCIDNLRLVSKSENGFNRSNTKGYTWRKASNKWVAQIQVNGKKQSLGYFDDENDARNAYLNAKRELHQIEIH